jgi:hypothetical protein
MTVSISGTNGLVFNDASTQNTAATGFGFKNRIINGAMMIDQRNAGASVTGNNFAVDRFKADTNGATATLTGQQSTTVPTSGFKNSLSYTATTTDTSLGTTKYYAFTQKIEGLNCADLNFGSSSAATVTLSFWVRSSLTGTFCVALRNSGATRAYVSTYTINAANTWEQKSVTIAGDQSGTWLTTNGVGIETIFTLASGTSFQTTANAWQAGEYLCTSAQTNFMGTSGATFYITGVQLEKGSTATSFDYRPYGTELALCQRYYYLLGKGSTFAWLGNAVCADTVEAVYLTPVPVPMRATPSFLTSGSLRLYNGATRAVTSSAINIHATPNIPATTFTASGGGMAAGQGVGLTANNDTAAFISYSAEL